MNDEQILWRDYLASPGEATFTPLYERTKGLVWTLCVRILGNPEDARDAFQSTYCRLVAELRAGTLAALPASALYRLTIREAQNLKGRLKRRTGKEIAVETLPPTPSTEPAADAVAAHRQLVEQIEAQLGQLPEAARLPLELHLIHGLTQAEIGAALNITQGHASRRIAKGLRQLERRLRQAGLADALRALAALGVGGALLAPPEALSAAAVYAHVQAVLAAGGLAAAAGGALAGKMSLGALLLKTKAAMVAGVAVLGLGALIVGRQFIASTPSGAGQNITMTMASTASAAAPAPAKVTLNAQTGRAAEPARSPAPRRAPTIQASPTSATASRAKRTAIRPAPRVDEKPYAVQGRVTDAAGRPLPLVTVQWLPWRGIARKPFMTATDENGRYRLDFESGAPECHVCAVLDSWAPEITPDPTPGKGQPIVAGPPERPAEVNLILHPGARLAGVVVDEAGKPVSKARVTAAPNHEMLTTNYMPVHRHAETDDAGAFTLDGLTSPTVTLNVAGPDAVSRRPKNTIIMGANESDRPTSLSAVIYVAAPAGGNWTPQTYERQPVGGKVRLTLLSATVITGRVVDRETGQPVTDFKVTGESERIASDELRGYTTRLLPKRIQSTEGRFVIKDPMLERGVKYTLFFTAEGTMSRDLKGAVAEPASSSTQHVIRLTRGHLLRGRVMDAATKHPIQGAKVCFASDGDNRSPGAVFTNQPMKKNRVNAETDGEGRFSIREDVAGDLMIIKPGYRHLIARTADRAKYRMGGDELWLPLARGLRVSGVAFNETGQPAKAGTYVSASIEGEPFLVSDLPWVDFSFGTKAGEGGRFTMDDLRPGRYTLWMHWSPPEASRKIDRHNTTVRIPFELKEGEEKTINIGGDRGTLTFKGRLLDAEGRTTGSLELRLRPEFSWRYGWFEELVLKHAPYNSTFEFMHLKPGKYKVEAVREREDYSEEIIPLGTVEIMGDTQRDLRLTNRN